MNKNLKFSSHPGRHERHLRRKQNNPLFNQPPMEISPDQLEAAIRRDEKETEDFLIGFRDLVEAVANLKPTEDSERILELKEKLDRAFEQSAGLGGDQRPVQEAIIKLVELIMQAVRRGAGDDPTALGELEQETAARSDHFTLLRYPLVADILAPDSLIAEDELVSALLCEPEEGLAATLQLFDRQQTEAMLPSATELLERLEKDGVELPAARQNLETIKAWLNKLSPADIPVQ